VVFLFSKVRPTLSPTLAKGIFRVYRKVLDPKYFYVFMGEMGEFRGCQIINFRVIEEKNGSRF
jgi:hypothetical protein